MERSQLLGMFMSFLDKEEGCSWNMEDEDFGGIDFQWKGTTTWYNIDTDDDTLENPTLKLTDALYDEDDEDLNPVDKMDLASKASSIIEKEFKSDSAFRNQPERDEVYALVDEPNVIFYIAFDPDKFAVLDHSNFKEQVNRLLEKLETACKKFQKVNAQ